AAFRETGRVLSPAGQFLFNVWGDKRGTARLLAEEIVGEKLSRDPASLVAPEYNDVERIRSDLAAVGFISTSVESVSKKTRSPSAHAAAIANCHGGMLRAQIDKLAPGRLDEITGAVETALAARFGNGPIEAPIHALLVNAVKPGH